VRQASQKQIQLNLKRNSHLSTRQRWHTELTYSP